MHDRTDTGAAADADAERSPAGCRWCGELYRAHFQRWADPPVGWHR